MEANLNSCKENLQDFQEKGAQKISAFDQDLNMKSDSFTVDMEPFSHLTNKDFTLTSRINRSLSRKGSETGAERKMMNSNCVNDGGRDAIPSPKACSLSVTMPEKFILVNQTTDHITKPQVQLHQIAIMTSGSTTTTKPAATPTKISLSVKRSSSFKQSSLFNPRRILIFFATLSSLGTIILICLTLSMAKYNGDNSHADATQLT